MFKNLFRKKTTVDPEKEFADWLANGKPAPPPHIVKQKAIAGYRDQYGTKVLVETGTYLGDMMEAQKNNFQQLYSIELSEKLQRRAARRFKSDNHITILQGDSGIKISEVLASLSTPALFWLDGHYSGGITAKADKECPVPEELNAILSDQQDHIVLIDDARLFNGTHDYPTIEQIKDIIQQHKKNYVVENKDDIIRLLPNRN